MVGVILTRRQLYDLVWSKPMRDVANNLGISDVGLAKVCDRHRVPRPPQGYWNKLHAGLKVKQTIFAEAADAALDRVEISGGVARLPELAREILAKAKAQREAKPPKPTSGAAEVPAPLAIEDVHPMVRPTARALRKARPDKEGAVRATGDGLCGVSVGSACVERAVAFLSALARQLETKGMQLVATGTAMKVAIGPDGATFTLSERTRREKHVPTDDERAAEERRLKRLRAGGTWSFFSREELAYPEFDIIRSAELIFKIEGYGDGARRTWADGKTQRLENLVDDIVTGIEVLLSVRRVQREEREEWQRRWRERERRQALAAQRAKREQKRQEFIADVIERDRKIEQLRTWLVSAGLAADALPGSHFQRVVSWARQRVSDLEAAADPQQVDDALRASGLFPETDDLHDPNGEPADET